MKIFSALEGGRLQRRGHWMVHDNVANIHTRKISICSVNNLCQAIEDNLKWHAQLDTLHLMTQHGIFFWSFAILVKGLECFYKSYEGSSRCLAGQACGEIWRKCVSLLWEISRYWARMISAHWSCTIVRDFPHAHKFLASAFCKDRWQNLLPPSRAQAFHDSDKQLHKFKFVTCQGTPGTAAAAAAAVDVDQEASVHTRLTDGPIRPSPSKWESCQSRCQCAAWAELDWAPRLGQDESYRRHWQSCPVILPLRGGTLQLSLDPGRRRPGLEISVPMPDCQWPMSQSPSGADMQRWHVYYHSPFTARAGRTLVSRADSRKGPGIKRKQIDTMKTMASRWTRFIFFVAMRPSRKTSTSRWCDSCARVGTVIQVLPTLLGPQGVGLASPVISKATMGHGRINVEGASLSIPTGTRSITSFFSCIVDLFSFCLQRSISNAWSFLFPHMRSSWER